MRINAAINFMLIYCALHARYAGNAIDWIYRRRAGLSDPIITRSVSEVTAYGPRLRFGSQSISPAGGIFEKSEPMRPD
jgi:hypothetical protein